MTNLSRKVLVAPAALLAIAAYACSGAESTPPGASSGTSGSGTSGSGGLDGSVPDLDAAPGASCPKLTTTTQAVHLIMEVTWAGSLGTNPGKGTVHVWSRAKLKFGDDNKITSVNVPCGTVVPDIQTTLIGGNVKVQPEFADAVWASTAMKTFEGTGAQSSFDVNSKVNIEASPALVGLTMADPSVAWPAAATTIQSADHDGDSHAGITATPKSGGGYALPPVGFTLPFQRANLLYIASRTTTSLSGVRDTCDTQKGTVTVTDFDNHVIGCHVEGGGECTPTQQTFVDDHRTIYKVVAGATYEAKVVPDAATCADVRAALPAK